MNALQSPPATGGIALFDLDRPTFDALCGKEEPFAIRHRLAGHPLFEVPRLLELAKALPKDRVEYNAGDLPVSVDPAQTLLNGSTPEETIRRIAECRSWLVLKNVERDPAYSDLLDACLREVERRGIIYRVNRWLRARGLTPTPAEVSGWRDRTKYFAYRVVRRLGLTGRPPAKTPRRKE